MSMNEQELNANNAWVVGISSDIGTALAADFRKRGWNVAGTFRTLTKAVEDLAATGVKVTELDLGRPAEFASVVNELRGFSEWDVLVVCIGNLNPIGPFEQCDSESWESSVLTNLVRPIRFINASLHARNRSHGNPHVILFAGGGINGAPKNYSAYTLSKVALVKACELLDAECLDTTFSILGPGWVNTKIHQATRDHASVSNGNIDILTKRQATNDFTQMDRVVACVDWVRKQSKQSVGGRNFSVVDDPWQDDELGSSLESDIEAYKLRREKRLCDSLASKQFNNLLETLTSDPSVHSPVCSGYALLKKVSKTIVDHTFSKGGRQAIAIDGLGIVRLPFFPMGSVTSLNLLDLDELIILAWYRSRCNASKRAADIGANIGLHSIVMSKCGFAVEGFEPDPIHFARLKENLSLNRCSDVTLSQCAVSSQDGHVEFIRIEGNTTGSHIAGAKQSVYGDVTRFDVPTTSFRRILDRSEILKIDVEGHELTLIESTTPTDWIGKEAMLEVGSEDAAAGIVRFFADTPITLMSQKTCWQPVKSSEDMPTSYKHGSLFISGTGRSPFKC